MTRKQSTSIFRIAAAFLMAVAFFVPAIHMVHAVEPNMAHDEMSMNCETRDCEDAPEAQSCLEHCLQTHGTETGIIAVHQPSTEIPEIAAYPLTYTVIEIAISRIALQNTGPPKYTDRHLTTQQRE